MTYSAGDLVVDTVNKVNAQITGKTYGKFYEIIYIDSELKGQTDWVREDRLKKAKIKEDADTIAEPREAKQGPAFNKAHDPVTRTDKLIQRISDMRF